MDPVQRIITSEKGVSLDFASVAKDSKAQSKELYVWGQNENEDLKDGGLFTSIAFRGADLNAHIVTDRLAYLNFVHGALSGTLASGLDSARSPFKALRDAEHVLQPKRLRRQSIQGQIIKLEREHVKGSEHRLAELKQQLHAAETEDAAAEKDIEVLKRKAVRESEQVKWAALREVSGVRIIPDFV